MESGAMAKVDVESWPWGLTGKDGAIALRLEACAAWSADITEVSILADVLDVIVREIFFFENVTLSIVENIFFRKYNNR